MRATEQELTGMIEGAALSGSADLVLEKAGRTAVLDLKLSRIKYYREKLEKGQALQVALYAEMASPGEKLPPTGYFLLNHGELLTVDCGAFPGAREIAGPPLQETLDLAREALRFWRKVLGQGLVASRHQELRSDALLEAVEAAGAAAPASGPCAIDPPCRYCEFGVLCGVWLREEAP